MKRNYTVRLALALFTGTVLASCGNDKPQDLSGKASSGKAMQHAHRDTSLNDLLKPVNEQVIASIPVIRATQGARIYIREVQGRVTYDIRSEVNLASRVSGRIEKLYVKYNYQPVVKGQLILELYSPDLAAAQRELLLIQRSGNQDQMLEPAKQRLLLLGMSNTQLNKLLRTGEVSYRIPIYSNATGYILEKQVAVTAEGPAAPAASSGAANLMDNMGAAAAGTGGEATRTATTAPVMLRTGQYLSVGQSIFTIYRAGDLVAEFSLTNAVAAELNRQERVIVQRTASRGESLTGRIGLIQPVFNAGENFVLARVYLQQSKLQVGELVTGQLPFLTDKGYWLPKEAVLSTGNKSVVFKKEGKFFVPETVRTGISAHNQVQVLNDIRLWDIAKSAYYLVDSESFVKTKRKGD